MTGAVQTSPRPHCGRMPLDAMRDPVRPLPGVRVETVELLTSVFPLRPEVVSGSAFGLAKTSVFILTFSCSGAARASSALGGSAGTFGVGGRRDTFPCRVPVRGAPEPCGLRRRRKYVRSEGVPRWLRPRFFTLTEIVVFTASAASHVRCGPFAAVPMRRTGLRRKGAGASRRRRRTAEEPENRRAEKPLAPCLAPPPERREERAREAAATESGGRGRFAARRKRAVRVAAARANGGPSARSPAAAFARASRMISASESGRRVRGCGISGIRPARRLSSGGGGEERARCYFFAPARAAIRLTSDMNVLASEAPEMRPRSSPSEVNIR